MLTAAVLACCMSIAGCAADAPAPAAPHEFRQPACITVLSPAALTELTAGALCGAEQSLTVQVPFGDAETIGACMEAARSRSILTRTGLTALDWTWTDGLLECRFTYGTEDSALLRREKAELALYAAEFSASAADFTPQARTLLAHDRLLRCCCFEAGAPQGDSAAGALLLHAAECGGYAEGFALLAEFGGLPCMILTGTANGMPHAWNLVQLDGAWYHIDCAWDDADGADAHAYFLRDDAAMRETHAWDAAAYPAAQGGKYSYDTVIAEMTADAAANR